MAWPRSLGFRFNNSKVNSTICSTHTILSKKKSENRSLLHIKKVLIYFRSGFATRKCYPVMDILQPASTLNYSQIKNAWYYKSTMNPGTSINRMARNNSVLINQKVLNPNPNSTHRIPIQTLEEWLNKFVGLNARSSYYQHLKLIWLDVKVPINR